MRQEKAWTDAEIERLKELHADRYSAREIGEELGRGRNAVIGKANRLGLSKPTAASNTRRLRRGLERVVKQAEAAAEAEHNHNIPAVGISMWSLTRHTCRYPLWIDGAKPGVGATYCGRRVLEGRSWCPDHFHVVRRDIGAEAG